MSRFRKVDPKVWRDARFRRLSERGKFLWLYLLTSPETTSLPGIIPIGRAAIAEELGWTLEAFGEAFGEVFSEGMAKADWKARLVWLPRAAKYNKPESPNVVLSWRNHWDCVPECALKAEAWRGLKAFVEGLPEAFGKAFAKTMANQEQEQEQEQEQYLGECERGANQAPPENRSEPEPRSVRKPKKTRTQKPAQRPATTLPADWTLTAALVTWGESADAVKIDRDRIAEEADKFRDHHGAKGSRFADWDAAFRTWLRNARKFDPGAPEPRKRPAPGVQPLPEVTAADQALADKLRAVAGGDMYHAIDLALAGGIS